MCISIIEGPLAGPYIYFIVSGELIYVGETQRHPVHRWSEHISSGGTYMKKIIGLECDKLKFVSVSCLEYFHSCTLDNYKCTTQAIEHSIHCLILAEPSLVGGVRKLISSTEKTAPRNYRNWELADAIGRDILKKIKNNI